MSKKNKNTKKSAPKKSVLWGIISTCIVMALVLGLAIGGTMAWLLDTTDSVKNTFDYSYKVQQALWHVYRIKDKSCF